MRTAQLTEFNERAQSGFVDRMLSHWDRCFSDFVRDRDKADLKALVDDGTNRAAIYGIVAERDVCLFLDVMLILGPRFENNPSYPWARHALRSPHLTDPSQRVRFLWACAEDYAPANRQADKTA